MVNTKLLWKNVIVFPNFPKIFKFTKISLILEQFCCTKG